MHPRHRSPVTAYKSSTMGMGSVATASRNPPDGSVRGRGLHNSEYRNYMRGGFGRGQSKQFVQPSHGNDLFIQAGRLAAEYLVNKGLLPPNALSEKLPNGSLKNRVGDFHGLKPQDGEIMQVAPEGRTSRLRSATSDVGPGRKRFPDEYNSEGSRNYMRGRRRNESFKNYGSEFDRELRKSGSWDRARRSPDLSGQDDSSSHSRDEQQVAKDSDGQLLNSLPGKLIPDIESAGESMCDLGPALSRNKLEDDSGKKTSPISTENDLPSEGELETIEKSDGMDMSKDEADQVDTANNDDGLEKKAAQEDIEVKPFCVEDNQANTTTNDLLSLCRFGNVPTRTRSSLANKDLKVCQDSVTEDEDAHEGGTPNETEVHSQDNPVDVPQSHDAKILNFDKLKSLPMEEESCLSYPVKQLNETSSSSFPESTLTMEGEKIKGLPGFESCIPIAMGRGEKRELDDDDCKGGIKRPRELALKTPLPDGFLYHSISMEKHQTSPESRTSHGVPAMFPSDEKRLVDISTIPKGDVGLGCDFTEKQLFPSSFKTFDLNLMQTSDVFENHDADPVHIFPAIAEGLKQEASVDIGLTMSSNCNTTNKYPKSSFAEGDIEVIDLENDSEQEDKAFNNPERRSEVYTGTDGFSNNVHSTNHIPDAQDGYGLMISELLGNDISNCSSVPADMNSLHNDMGLHNGEGMLGDDDSIYMSLEEIPISFLGAWEQPTQDFGKPF